MPRAKPPSPAVFFDDKNRAFWMLQSAGWTGYLLLRVASGIANGLGLPFLIQVLVSAATGYSMTLVMAAAYRWFIRKSPLVIWAGTLATVVVAVAAFSVIDAWVFTMVNEGRNVIQFDLFLGSAVLNALLLGGWSALYYSINFFLIAERQTLQLLKLEATASSAQLAMLRYQLNPHFLFNTLNNLYYLAFTNSPNTTEVIAKLSQMMRYMIYDSNHPKVLLGKEIEYMQNYISLEKLRLNEQIPVCFTVEGNPGQVLVMPLIFITFLENAFKHGVSNSSPGAWVNVRINIQGSNCVYTVENSKLPENGKVVSEKSGIGLQNVRRRLDLSYPGQYQLSEQDLPDRYAIRLQLAL